MRPIRLNAAGRQKLVTQLYDLAGDSGQPGPCREVFKEAGEVLNDLERRNRQLRQAIGGFADYYEPAGGVSNVPAGPFHRAAETLGVRDVGVVSSSGLRALMILACDNTEE